MTNVRYQVFVSSTYLDLVEERREVSEQLQRLRCIPGGMELFTASGLPPWHLIQSAIDDTDYMVLILAGRYGSSVGEGGLSYTEREYDYALSLGVPILAFLHTNIRSLPFEDVDSDAELVKKREAFWSKVRDSERHTVDFWTYPSDLAQKVLTAVPAAIATQPRPGWVRGTGEPADMEGHTGSATTALSLATADDVRDALVAPGGVARIERAIGNAARSVTELPFVQGQADYSGGDVQSVHAERVAALEEAAIPLVQLVAAAARWGKDLDGYWLDLIREMSANPRLGGFTALVELVRAPAVLVFTAAGLGACAGRRDNLLGLLLSEQFEVDNPYREEDAPAVAMLLPTLVYPNGWAAKTLRTYFESSLSQDEAWSGSTFDRAWERWEYLCSVARTYYASTRRTSSGGMPYLRIEDRVQNGPRPVVAKTVRKDVANRGDEHPLLGQGLCDGSAELFDTAAETFDSRYGKWGNDQDWGALPSSGGLQGGAMPTAAHYPGDRSSV